MNNFENIKHIKEVLDEIRLNILNPNKPLSFKEACKYCDISESTMYKHTSAKKVPHYKPEGKNIYFIKEELDQWMLRNRQSTNDELMREASKYSINQKRKC